MKVACAIMFLASLPNGGLAQTSGGRSDSQGCHIGELLNREGWQIPGLSKTTTTLKGSRWTTGGLENVFVDIMKSKVPNSSVVLISCIPDRPGRVQFSDKAIRVMEILRFSMNGRVFAYRVTAQFMGIENKRTRVPLASEMMLTFYDEDGSGRFTVMQYPSSGLIPKLNVPDWVKAAQE